jgi:hypothetical protein
MGPATREYLTALVAFTLLILFMAIGAAVGVSIVPYWVGGWEFVIKVWKLNGAGSWRMVYKSLGSPWDPCGVCSSLCCYPHGLVYYRAHEP